MPPCGNQNRRSFCNDSCNRACGHAHHNENHNNDKNTVSQPHHGRSGERPSVGCRSGSHLLALQYPATDQRSARIPGGAGSIRPEPDPAGPCRRRGQPAQADRPAQEPAAGQAAASRDRRAHDGDGARWRRADPRDARPQPARAAAEDGLLPRWFAGRGGRLHPGGGNHQCHQQQCRAGPAG
ncbi:hypothetical protein D3C84_770870 [compost metagenome]